MPKARAGKKRKGIVIRVEDDANAHRASRARDGVI
jgi:hypothetical protein